MQRYNIALLPMTTGSRIIQYAQQLSSIADCYVLGENALPHLTLCQFMANETSIPSIWEEVMQRIEQPCVHLEFKRLSFKDIFDYFWVSLIPEKRQVLDKMHYAVAKIIKTPLNFAYENYDPHITLINTKFSQYETWVKQQAIENWQVSDEFILSLGKSDDLGQYLESIY